jgi:uncharacterized membrane protein YqjE
MTEPSGKRSSDWGATARRTAGELARMIQLRRDLADLEIRHDRALVKRFLLVGGTAALLVLCGLPLLLTAAALGLAQVTDLGAVGWLSFFGAVLVLPGAVALVLSVRGLRSEFCGLSNTLAELREDLVWIREWASQETDHPWGAR